MRSGHSDKRLRLAELRYNFVSEFVESEHCTCVMDLGCAEGKLIELLLRNSRLRRILGIDHSSEALREARLRIANSFPDAIDSGRVELVHGTFMQFRDNLTGFDAAVALEVIEHLTRKELRLFERTVFRSLDVPIVIVSTPNREYNVLWPDLSDGQCRTPEHKFEFSRAEFKRWSMEMGNEYGYSQSIHPIGIADAAQGAPTQLAVFHKPPH